MNSFLSLAQNRRSTRKFKSNSIPAIILEQLLSTVLMSPASKRSNPWEFIVVDNAETKEILSQAKPHGGSFIKHAPIAIVVAADPEKSDVWVEDTSIASIYLQLAAEDLGLGSCWVQIHKRTHEDGSLASDFIKEKLGLPKTFEVESIIAIGYKDEDKKPFDTERSLFERVHLNKFSQEFTWSKK